MICKVPGYLKFYLVSFPGKLIPYESGRDRLPIKK